MKGTSHADSSLLILPDSAALARKTYFVTRESPKMGASNCLRTLAGTVASGSEVSREASGFLQIKL